MISKSKRMRYRWITIEGDLSPHLKDLKLRWNALKLLKASYSSNIIQLRVYRSHQVRVLREIYLTFYAKKLSLVEFKVRITHSYKRKKVQQLNNDSNYKNQYDEF